MPSGIAGLDEVLGGGMLRGGLYLVAGGPGTGKTVMANQICFSRARAGERCLYITLLAESHSRMLQNLESLEFFDPDAVEERVAYVAGARNLREGGLSGVLDLVKVEVQRRRPALLVLDGIRSGRHLDDGELGYPEFFHRLAALLEFSDCTTVASTLYEPGVAAPEHAMADGLVELRHIAVGRRSVRQLAVWKTRGSRSLEGSHVFEIDGRGLIVYPRTEAKLARDILLPGDVGARCQFGIASLDQMLRGGLPVGTSTAIIGAPGTGKTLLGLHFLARGATAGERGLYFGFYESPDRVIAQGDGLGMGLSGLARGGQLEIAWKRPFEHLLDRVVDQLLAHVEARDIRRLYIDGIEGMRRGAAFPESLPTVLAALTNELRARGVSTLFSLEGELLGSGIGPNMQWSALAENVIVLRYVELRSHLRRLLWLVKVRGSDFDTSIREFAITPEGLRVADTFESAEFILSGTARAEAPDSGGSEGGARP